MQQRYIITGTAHHLGPAVPVGEPFARFPAGEFERLSVLVVDDDPQVLQSTRRMLGLRYKVGTASSAEQAMVALRQERYNLLITDWDMPGKDGLWLLDQVKKRYPTMRRGLTSGSTSKAINGHLKSGLAEFFLPKPAAYDELVTLISSRPHRKPLNPA